MEGISVKAYRGLKGYWKKRGYERLQGESARRSSAGAAEQQGSNNSTRRRRRFSWRPVKVKKPRVKLLKLIRAPKRFLIWLRDAYVKMMLGFANSRVCSASYGGGGGAGVGAFGRGPLKEYDQKVIVEIYKSVLVARGQLAAKEPAGNGTLYRIQE